MLSKSQILLLFSVPAIAVNSKMGSTMLLENELEQTSTQKVNAILAERAKLKLASSVETCPVSYLKKFTDLGEYSWTDDHGTGDVWNSVTPDRVDNAGFYQSTGWDRLPQVIPTQTGLKDKEYTAGQNTTVNFYLYDQYGNSKNCTIDVEVIDNEDPQITCPPNKPVNTIPTMCVQQVSWSEPSPTDNQPGAPTLTSPFGGTNGGMYNPENSPYTIRYNVTDMAGNTDSCTFVITVSDNEKPNFDTNNCKTLNGDEGVFEVDCGAIDSHTGVEVEYECPAMDNCDTGSLNEWCSKWVEIQTDKAIHPNAGHAWCANGDCVDVGCFTSEIDALDTGCTPGYYSSGETSKFCYLEHGSGTLPWCAKIFSNHSEAVTISSTKKLFFYGESGDDFPVPPMPELPYGQSHPTTEHAKYIATCYAKDTSDNERSKTITWSVIDSRKKPHFEYCPTETINVTLDTQFEKDTISPNFTEPRLATSSCNTSVVEVNGKGPNQKIAEGQTAFRYIATDTHGNTKECIFSVRVFDPVEMVWANCPEGEITVETDDKLGIYGIPSWTEPEVYRRGAPVSDASLFEVTDAEYKPGMAFPLGKTTVTYYFKDMREHMADYNTSIPCSFIVNVVDREVPTFQGGWNDRQKCGESEAGVDEYELCGGTQLIPTKTGQGALGPGEAVTNYIDNIAITKTVYPEGGELNCCGGKTCSMYNNSYIKMCQ